MHGEAWKDEEDGPRLTEADARKYVQLGTTILAKLDCDYGARELQFAAVSQDGRWVKLGGQVLHAGQWLPVASIAVVQILGDRLPPRRPQIKLVEAPVSQLDGLGEMIAQMVCGAAAKETPSPGRKNLTRKKPKRKRKA